MLVVCLTQQENRKLGTVEFWRRFQNGSCPPAYVLQWYFDDQRQVGDLINLGWTSYQSGNQGLRTNFANFPVDPKQTLIFKRLTFIVGETAGVRSVWTLPGKKIL